MGRNAKPIALIAKEGKTHKTKEEIEARKQAEEGAKLGLNELKKLKPPPFIENDVAAFSHWKELLAEYIEAAGRGVELLSTTDVGSLATYCKTFAEYEALLMQRDTLASVDMAPRIKNPVKKNQVNFLAKFETNMKLEAAINKKVDMLIKQQDRLFLNPLAKIKNVPRPEKKKAENPMERKYNV